MSVGVTRLRGVRTVADAIALLGELGYTRPALPFDIAEFPVEGVHQAMTLREGSSARRGYVVFVGETDRLPRSLRPIAKSLRHLHDRPLALIGVRGEQGEWTQLVIVRPQVAGGRRGSALTKLVVDLSSPTQHDTQVVSGLAWRTGDDRAAHAAIDQALDADAVTKRFFVGLREHYDKLVAGVTDLADNDDEVRDRLKTLGDDPYERAALRILTQVLFVEFLQRKGFVEDRVDWLTRAFQLKKGPFYATVLEPLFYDVLGCPESGRTPGLPDAPYLNGGLFERFYGDLSLNLPDSVFDLDVGLLGYLNSWTFTAAEEMPDEAEVAVDPEMLGKVFEHLCGEDSVQKHGTVYTPRPVVHFMCREALVPWLQEATAITENQARVLLTETHPFLDDALGAELEPARINRLASDLDDKLDELRVLDPAVGSGAFPLGMLSEIVRLRTLCFSHLNGGLEPSATQVTHWKWQAIKHVLFGVDIEPRAIELCRLRLWLSLIVDLPAGQRPEPLPNLEYRTVVANSLTDYANGVEIQNTRGGLDFFSEPGLADLHDRWFHATGTEREEIRAKLTAIEDEAVARQLQQARTSARSDAERDQIDEIATRFSSRDRAFPCFVPALHAPDVATRGGWDIVIMNPPYVSRKEAAQRLTSTELSDLELHYGKTADLMILFGWRALQYARPGGITSMIFNDSITTSTDGEDLRRHWADDCELLSLARTRCFVGKAITGGIVIVRSATDETRKGVRWVEGHGRPADAFTDASDPLDFDGRPGKMDSAGDLEVWCPPRSTYRRLPHRPQFRPSPPALIGLGIWEGIKSWKDEWSRWDSSARTGWRLLSNTRALNTYIEGLKRGGYYDNLKPGDWSLLGLCITGGVGLQTGDDRRFLAAIEGTEEAAEVLQRQIDYEQGVLDGPFADVYRKLERSVGTEQALVELWEKQGNRLRWPRSGLLRVAAASALHSGAMTDDDRSAGFAGKKVFVPFEKGDDSDEVDGHAIGATWWRNNPVVIDWSTEAVTLLRTRASSGESSRKPYFRNEEMYGLPGVTWNRVASYFRCRLVPPGAIFCDKAPTVRPTVQWLSTEALMAFLNSDTADFLLRTFLGSRMQIEIGDVRRLPVPVLDVATAKSLDRLGSNAVLLKEAGDDTSSIEREINVLVRNLYSIPQDAELWVVR